MVLFDVLSSDARRGLARNLFSGFYERGISANKALGELQELGLGYRRQDFLSDYSSGRGVYEQYIKVRFVNLDKVPTESILQPLYHGVPDKYSMVYQAWGYDKNTGDPREQHFFYHTNTMKTRKALEAEARAWFESQSDKYAMVVEGVRIREGYINPVWAD